MKTLKSIISYREEGNEVTPQKKSANDFGLFHEMMGYIRVHPRESISKTTKLIIR